MIRRLCPKTSQKPIMNVITIMYENYRNKNQQPNFYTVYLNATWWSHIKIQFTKKLNDYISVQLITNTHIPQYDNQGYSSKFIIRWKMVYLKHSEISSLKALAIEKHYK